MKKLNFKSRLKENLWMQLTLAIAVGVVLFLVLAHIAAILAALRAFLKALNPVIYGVVLAYLISPLVSFIERKILKNVGNENVRHQLSNVLALFTVLVLLAVLLSFLIPQLVDSAGLFIGNINTYAETLQETLRSIAELGRQHNIDMSVLDSYTTGLLTDIVSFVSSNASRIAAGSLTLTNNALNVGLGLILTVYFLVYKNEIMREYHILMEAVLSENIHPQVTSFISECNKIMATYVVSDVIDAIIIGFVNAIYMAVTDTPYLVLISVVVAVFNLLPTFGPFVGAFIAAIILLFADVHTVIPFLVFTLALQLVDGYIIKPRLFGGALGVPGVWISLGIVAGGRLFGFVGVLLSAPTVAILAFIIEKLVGLARARKDAAHAFAGPIPDTAADNSAGPIPDTAADTFSKTSDSPADGSPAFRAENK